MENIENEEINGKIKVKTMEEVMHDSMMPYSEFVILDRALPRVEDGLKPVQRRILYTMHELGLSPDKPHRKCARIVGDCLGKFHPHGDSSVYQALVRMAQSFNMGTVLVDGHGNFGSIDGDSAAAMRYTEARMAPIALELLRDLEKNTVRWSCNFDDSLMEPDMLPGRFPNLLVNGAAGIAVGLATNIPPHNIGETIDGVIAFIDKPTITLKEMMRHIKGPDFPSGGYMIAGDELLKAYSTGKGKLTIRSKIHIEMGDNDKKLIVLDELPYQVNKATLLENILKAREEKKGVLSGIYEITDESDRNGMRAVIKVKRDSDPKEILERLYKATNLSTTFGVNMVAIANGKPQQMSLLEIIDYYVNYQREVILKRTKYELEQAKEREHILEGLVIAVKNIDEVIKIIRSSANTSEARDRLRKRFKLSERQAQAILDLRLARLTHLEIYKLEKELAEIKALIKRLSAIVASKKLQMEVVKNELLEIKKTYKQERRTVILKTLDDYVVPSEDDERPLETYMVGVNTLGNIKKILLRNYSLSTKEFNERSTQNEICPHLIEITSKQTLYCFTNLGNCYKVDVNTIPDARWREKGRPLDKVIAGVAENERIVYLEAIEEDLPTGNLLFYTKEGMVKKTAWKDLNVVKSEFQVIKLKEEDEVIAMEQEKKGNTLLFITKGGMCLNADMSDIPLQGRIAGGVKGIQLSSGDECLYINQITQEGEVAIITETAFGKRVLACNLDVMARYRKGVKIIDFKKTNGTHVLFARYVKEPITMVLIEEGQLAVFPSEALSIESRVHSGKGMLKGKHKIQQVLIYNSGDIKY